MTEVLANLEREDILKVLQKFPAREQFLLLIEILANLHLEALDEWIEQDLANFQAEHDLNVNALQILSKAYEIEQKKYTNMAYLAKNSSFETWDTDEVEHFFKLTQDDSLPVLQEWLEFQDVEITTQEQEKLDELRDFISKHIHTWNEEEFKMHGIAQILALVNYYNPPQYRTFFERTLSLQVPVNDQIFTIKGKVDFIIAKGKRKPLPPIFCLHEYKADAGTDKDPFGQLLIAMYAAQQQNSHTELPVYGAVITGRICFFLVLQDKTYGMSPSFDASKAEIFDIFRIFKKLKLSLIPAYLAQKDALNQPSK